MKVIHSIKSLVNNKYNLVIVEEKIMFIVQYSLDDGIKIFKVSPHYIEDILMIRNNKLIKKVRKVVEDYLKKKEI